MKKIYSFTFGSLLLISLSGNATTWQVGSARTYKTPSSVAALVQDGDVVEIDAGTYTGNVCYWSKNNLTLRGVGGLAHLNANNTAYGRKGIWVIGGSNATVENIEFSNCHDVAALDKNWAGIRLEGTGLTVRNCYFHDNDNGILCGANATSDIVIEYTEFNHNGFSDGYSHNLYIGNIRSLTFSHNYSHHATVGHELKSRAATNYILYNRIGNEATGDASREIDLPNGGLAIIIGNQIQQSASASNGNIIGYGMEGLSNPGPHECYLVNNTVVNNRSAGTFVQISTSTAKYKAYNNIFTGPGGSFSGTATVIDTLKNWIVPTVANAKFVDATTYDYHLLSTASSINKGAAAGTASNGFSLTPTFEYKHSKNRISRTNVGTIDIGAYEYGNVSTGITNIAPSAIEFYVYTDHYDNSINVFFANQQGDKDVYIYDITGKLLTAQKKIASSKISFDKSLFAAGIYIVQAKTGNSLTSKKFIVE